MAEANLTGTNHIPWFAEMEIKVALAHKAVTRGELPKRVCSLSCRVSFYCPRLQLLTKMASTLRGCSKSALSGNGAIQMGCEEMPTNEFGTESGVFLCFFVFCHTWWYQLLCNNHSGSTTIELRMGVKSMRNLCLDIILLLKIKVIPHKILIF